MKRFFYCLVILLLIPITIKAEDSNINCEDNPYACVQCTYDGLVFTAYSDGKNVNVDIQDNSVDYTTTIRSFDVVSTNFIMDTKLSCPAILYYTMSNSGRTVYYDYSFVVDLNKTMFHIDITDSYNNNKNIYEDENKEVLSCQYMNNITLITDGTEVWIENHGDYFVDSIPDVSHFLDDNGNLLKSCPNFGFTCTDIGTKTCVIWSEEDVGDNRPDSDPEQNADGQQIEAQHSFIIGKDYYNLLGALKNPLVIGNKNFSNLKLTINGNENATLNDVEVNNNLCQGNECLANNEYYIEQGLSNIVEYCNILYENYPNYKTHQDNLRLRMNECISFQNFYQEGVKNNVFADYTDNCGILSEDMRYKLTWILDIIKIAGPILAVGLGTLDFVKVVASGDADKEMKSAFKRFGTRIVAAVLLFLIPVILAFLMDTFLGNQDGYDSNNPFCGMVDWSE